MRGLLRNFRICMLTVLFAVSLYGQERGDTLALRFLPARHLVHDFVADGAAHRFSATQLFSPNEVQVGVGGILPLLGYEVWEMPVQLSTAASIQARLDPGRRIAVQSSEFSIDFFVLDIQMSRDLVFRTGMSHSSHHLGDGELGDSAVFPIDYSRDEIQVFIIHPSSFFRGQVYAGLRYAYALVIHRPVHKPVSLQIGVHTLAWSFSQELSLYGGWDIKVRQELSYGTSQRYEAGLQYTSEDGRILRFSISYSGGFDERGQFFGEHRRGAGVGIIVSL